MYRFDSIYFLLYVGSDIKTVLWWSQSWINTKTDIL